MSFLEKFLKNANEIRKMLYDDEGLLLDNISLEDLAKYSEKELKRFKERQEYLKREVLKKRLLRGDREKFIKVVEDRLRKIDRAMVYKREPIKLIEAHVSVSSRNIRQNKNINVVLKIVNHADTHVKLTVTGGWSEHFTILWNQISGVHEIPPHGWIELKAELKAVKQGSGIIGPFQIEGVGEVKGKAKTDSVVVSIAPPLTPRLVIEKKIDKSKVKDGEWVYVDLVVRNVGSAKAVDVALEDNVENLEIRGDAFWMGELEPGEKKRLRYAFKARKGMVMLLPAKASYRDEEGANYEVYSNSVKIEVEPVEIEAKPVAVAEEKVDIETLLGEAAKLSLSAALGYALASLAPAIKRFKKEVVVDKGVRWTTREYKGEKVTVILEHPIAVVKEDMGDYLLLRQATTDELLAAIDGRSARRMEDEFIDLMKGVVNKWKPREEYSLDRVREYSLVENYRKIVEDKCKLYGVEFDYEKFGKLPQNKCLEAVYATKGLFKRRRFKVIVIVFSRIDKLYFDEHSLDHSPLSYSEVKPWVDSFSGKERTLVVLASPTGWDPDSRAYAEKRSDPRVSLMLVDLKKMKTYYNNQDPLLVDIATYIASYSPQLPPLPREIDKELEILDEMLLEGAISEDMYLKKLGEILKKALVVEAKTKS